MSWNNITPWWLIELEHQRKVLTDTEFLNWLNTEGKNLLPPPVLSKQIQETEMRIWNL